MSEQVPGVESNLPSEEFTSMSKLTEYLKNQLSQSKSTEQSLGQAANHILHSPTATELADQNVRPEVKIGDNKWENRAACKPGVLPAHIDVDDFFPAPTDVKTQKLVKKICKGDVLKNILPCPVINECAEHALTYPEKEGIWGGMTPRERKRLTR